jgi:hypothetical protein
MSNIGAKQGCPLSPTLVGLYIDELETNLKEINMVSLCLFCIVVVIFLYVYVYVDVLLSMFGVGLQRLLNKVYEICTSSNLGVNLCKTKIMIFEIDLYSRGYFEPSSKRPSYFEQV